MSDAGLGGVIGAIGGVVVALVAAWVAVRRTPSKTIFNAQTLAAASGLVVTNLTAEIGRLDTELAEQRTELNTLKLELKARPTREELFEANGKLRKQLLEEGITPINGAPSL